MLSTCAGLSSGLCPEWLACYLTTHIPLVRRGLWITTVQPLLARSNDVRRTVGSPVTAGGSVCAITSSTHDGGPQVRLQRDENATPMLPSSTVVARCACTPSVALSVDVPLHLGVRGHDDQAWSRQAPEWTRMGVFHRRTRSFLWPEANCEGVRCPRPLLGSRSCTGRWR